MNKSIKNFIYALIIVLQLLAIGVLILCLLTACKQISYPDYNTTCETDIWGNTDCIIVN